MMIARTVSRSLTATRAERSSYGVARPDAIELVGGVDFAGLGCALEEWDAIAATMPESVRPSVRGAWSPAFERACVAFRAQHVAQPLDAGPQLQDVSPSDQRPVREVKPGGINWDLSAQILAVLGPAALSMSDILAAVHLSTPASVKMTVYRLVHVGAIKRVGPRQRDGYRYAAGRRISGAES